MSDRAFLALLPFVFKPGLKGQKVLLGAPDTPGVEVGHESQWCASLQDAGLLLAAAAWVLVDIVEDEGRRLVQGAEIQRVTGGCGDVHNHWQSTGLQPPALCIHDLCGKEVNYG